nr:protein of unknown function with PCYCGC motif protein [uncultured bacterium]
MKKKPIIAILFLIAAGIVAVTYLQPSPSVERGTLPSPSSSTPQSNSSAPVSNAALVPAHFESPPAKLPPTLAPEKFPGKTREAYQAAKEIPQTLSQLPCYCHCDRGMGHKSLHSCFEDDHAAHCATCIDEALVAYRLQKDQQLSPKEIRERIIAAYSGQ